MHTLFLNVRRGTIEAVPAEGQDFDDVDAARDEACIAARQLVSEALFAGAALSDALDGEITVKDEAGTLLLTISFEEAVRVRRSNPARGPSA